MPFPVVDLRRMVISLRLIVNTRLFNYFFICYEQCFVVFNSIKPGYQGIYSVMLPKLRKNEGEELNSRFIL